MKIKKKTFIKTQGGSYKALAILFSLNQDNSHLLTVKVAHSLVWVMPIKKHQELF